MFHVMWSFDYLAKVPFDVALAAVGGDDQQEEQGRSQHHLVEEEEVLNLLPFERKSLTAVWEAMHIEHTVAGSWTIETPRGCLSFALPPGCFAQLLGIIRFLQLTFPATPCCDLMASLQENLQTLCCNGLPRQQDDDVEAADGS